MTEQGCIITTNFSQDPNAVFGKLVIAPTAQAQIAWELWQKNPNMFTLAPGYIVKKEKDGVILEAELVELSLIPKILEKK